MQSKSDDAHLQGLVGTAVLSEDLSVGTGIIRQADDRVRGDALARHGASRTIPTTSMRSPTLTRPRTVA